MRKRILITGGSGFSDSHLCKRLLKEGNEFICVDNFYTGNKRNTRPFIISCQGGIIENKLEGVLTWKKDLILKKRSKSYFRAKN